MKPIRLITAFLCGLCLLLVSCAPITQRETTPELPAATYLKMAATANPPEKQSYLISAADRYLQDRELTEANQVLTSIDVAMLPPNLLVRYQLAKAKFLILHHQEVRALSILNQLNDNTELTEQQRLTLSSLYVMAYQAKDNVLGAIDHYNQMLNLSTDADQRQSVLLQTWDYLQSLPTASLLKMSAADTLTPLQKGWIELVLIATNDHSELQQRLTDWRQQFPEHPANALLPTRFETDVATQTKQVALLLPMTGPLASTGTAIRNGFFAAYYADKKQNPNSPNVKVIDTNGGHIGELYQQAIQQGADFIVGPLTKDNVRNLTALNQLPVRTLALNTLAEPIKEQPHLYQFGLSPFDEVSQVVNKAWQDNHTRAIIIAPQGAWGDTISKAFADQWQQQGGIVVDNLRFGNLNNLSSQIRQLLNIEQAQARYRQLRYTINKKIRFIPYRRQDVDMIFLAAQPNAARQVRPLLKYYYAGSLPVYALSSIYSGSPDTRLDRDLNGIFFCDMPWVIDPSKTLSPTLDQIRNNISKLWPKSYQQNIKLYALGVDAYDLVGSLGKLTLLPKFGISGATGRLYLDPEQHIYRRLLWAQMRNSQPEPLN